MPGLPRLLLVFPGPNYRIEESYGERATALSKEFCGDIITTAPKESEIRRANFRLIAVRKAQSTVVTYLRLQAKIRELIRTNGTQYSLVSTYDPLRSGALGLWLKRTAGVPLVCEVNGDYNDPANYFDQRLRLARWTKRNVYAAFARYVVSRADIVKTLYRQQLSALGIHSAVNAVEFRNRVAIEKFYSGPSEKVLLSVGFPWYVKGMDITVVAFRSIAAEFPDWRLKLVGHFPPGSLLHRLAEGCDQIEICRAVHHAEMPAIIARAAVLVQASRTEAMGRALIEAMAAEKPCIATRVGGIGTVVRDKLDGLLVDSEDVLALASAMRALMSDPDLRTKMGLSGRTRAAEEFSENLYYERLRRMYRDVIEART